MSSLFWRLNLCHLLFAHSEGCLFVLFMVSFAVQKLLSLIRFHLFILFSFSLLWEVGQKRSCCDLCQTVLCFLLGVDSVKSNIQVVSPF